jgi:hypothetical protein
VLKDRLRAIGAASALLILKVMLIRHRDHLAFVGRPVRAHYRILRNRAP